MSAYAYTRQLTAAGDWSFSGDAFDASPAPALEIVLLTLRTWKGRALAVPTFGTDWSRVNKLGTNALADASGVLSDALVPLVRRGVIADLKLNVEVDATRGVLVFDVDFYDPEARKRRSTGRQDVP